MVISQMLQLLAPGGIILIGDIPDLKRKNNFYNTLQKKIILLKDNICRKNTIGKFWSKEELDAICLKFKDQVQYFLQPQELPFAHYRFDYLIFKN